MAIVNPTIDHYKDFASRSEAGFRDYFFQGALRGDDGRDYFLCYSITRMENRDDAHLVVSTDPIWFFTTPSSKIIQKGEKPEIEIRISQPLGAIKTDVSDSALMAKIDAFEVTCTPPTYRFQYQGEEVSLDIKMKSLGIPFWFNQGREEGARVTPSSIIRGHELFGGIKGSMVIKGKEIGITGVAVYEHIISEHIAWMEFGWQDWIWFVFDELYGLILDMHGGRYKDGGIYLVKEKEYLVINDFDIDHPQWAFSPTLQHHFPMGISVKAITEKGTLFIEGNVVRFQPWRRINKYKHAVTIPASDMELKWAGSFTYNDGRAMTLKNGRGGDEVIAIYNFAQCNP